MTVGIRLRLLLELLELLELRNSKFGKSPSPTLPLVQTSTNRPSTFSKMAHSPSLSVVSV